jgi:hypothetical protein
MKEPTRRFPPHTWIGLAVLALLQLGVAAGHPLIATWLTPMAWTGYILAVDGFVARASGHSWLTTRRREAPLLVLASIGLWLVFEAYNIHLKNWGYLGLPSNPILRDLGYAWSFATIAPGVFETADLVYIALRRRRAEEPVKPASDLPGRKPSWILVGIAMVTIPLALPPTVAAYSFGAVWLGFFFLVDPVNELLGAPSLARSWRLGHRLPAISLLLAGALCGFLWEAWNFQAMQAGGAYWVYTLPQGLRVIDLHFGQMPVLGLLGFPPFALELFALYNVAKAILGIDRLLAGSAP